MESYLHTATILANILDNQFNFLGVRLGFNTILDLIPEFGDVIATLLSLYIIWLAIKLRVPGSKIMIMFFNVGINLILGAIPILGSVAYIVNKANVKNLRILKDHIKQNDPRMYSTVSV